MSNKSFSTLGLNDMMVNVTEQLYFKEPTEIQEKAIPLILQGKCLVGQSQTGSGKTHAFLLPLLNNLEETKNDVQIVITAPTRELAIQLAEEIKTIRKLAGKEDAWKMRLIIGGLDRKRMMEQLKTTTPHIVVGTPGRILDMVEEGVLSIYHARSFVIDEADLMLDLKFIDKIDALLVRSHKDIQILVFSATIPEPLTHFIKKYLERPVMVKIDHHKTPKQLEHRMIEIKEGMDPFKKLIEVVHAIQPYVAIVFTNSKEMTEEVAKLLIKEGKNAVMLHGDLPSRERKRVVKGIHQLQFEYIVATDLASRGIDIKGASHVINFELPKEKEFYIHRVGRIARAGGEGTAISFYYPHDRPLIEKLEKDGIRLLFNDIKNGEFVAAKRFDDRKRRKNKADELDALAWKMVKKPKKIKPGYKKKMIAEKERIKRRLAKQFRNKRG